MEAATQRGGNYASKTGVMCHNGQSKQLARGGRF